VVTQAVSGGNSAAPSSIDGMIISVITFVLGVVIPSFFAVATVRTPHAYSFPSVASSPAPVDSRSGAPQLLQSRHLPSATQESSP
jgi:hypothetical protein